MRSSTGRWVSGEDFFNRENELDFLARRIQERNHVLLAGQRRLGKTSIVRELGRRLESDGWIVLFVDVEGASRAEDVIADIAQAAYPHRSVVSRFGTSLKRWFGERVDEPGAQRFRVKARADINAGGWRSYGERLFRDCARRDGPVLLVIDELPIFLKRMVRRDGGPLRADEFLGWLRGVVQSPGARAPVLIVSGSIGLKPLARKLGISDRINYLDTFHLDPWDRPTSIACFERLAASHGLMVEKGVADAVYDALGVGIPHQVQSFFARLRDDAIIGRRRNLAVADVNKVYRLALLGPSGQNDLAHYETRLNDALGRESYSLAMEILAEAATQGIFTHNARRRLETLYTAIIEDADGRTAEILDVLMHDGYLESCRDGHRFASRLLRDWWSSRFRSHHEPLLRRGAEHHSSVLMQ